MLAQSSGIVNITFCSSLKAKPLSIDHSFEVIYKYIYIYIYIHIYIYMYVFVYTLYNGGIQVKPEYRVLNMSSNLCYGMGQIKLSSYMPL